MDSANLYDQLDTAAYQLSFATHESTHGRATIHEWYPTLQNLNTDEYNRYMNEILPNSKEAVLLKSWKPNFVDMGYKYYESCESPPSTNNTQINAVDLNQNLWLTNSSLSSSNLQGRDNSNNHMLNNCHVPWSSTMGMGLMSTSSQYSTHDKGLNLGMDFSSYINNGDNCSHSSKDISPSFSNYDSCYSPSSTGSNKTLSSRKEATNPARTKRSVSTYSSQKRPSQKAAAKKPKAAVPSQSSSHQLPKVGKEKIGDRIAALHKLVAPFGKTDTATVLTEANGYIHFLQHQIQTLSMPCEKPPSRRTDVHRFFEEIKQDEEELDLEAKQDLKSRGLCLVPLSFASYVGLESMISW